MTRYLKNPSKGELLDSMQQNCWKAAVKHAAIVLQTLAAAFLVCSLLSKAQNVWAAFMGTLHIR